MTWIEEPRPKFMGNHTTMTHLDGVPWWEAPVPSRIHRCTPQTEGWIGFDQVWRCACGAIRNPRFRRWPRWADKNSRKRSENRDLPEPGTYIPRTQIEVDELDAVMGMDHRGVW